MLLFLHISFHLGAFPHSLHPLETLKAVVVEVVVVVDAVVVVIIAIWLMDLK